jgi:ribosomal protein L16 Arg81 hydroxylase
MSFQKLRANEVILQPGDVLYLPTYWIHYIISLNVNFQCNTRSGITADFNAEIKRCGF